MKRRTLIQAGLAAGLFPGLAACGRSPAEETGFYGDGVYLSGNFGPVDVETTAMDLPVRGELPPELTGRYLRNGPNPIEMPNHSRYHWFTGDGMIHGVRLEEGRAAWYRNRWIRSGHVLDKLGEGDRNSNTGPGPNTHIISHGGRTWALVESGPSPVAIGEELETLGARPSWGSYTAHPKLDPDTGELHAINYNWASYRDHVKYTVRDREGELTKTVDIPMPGMTMIHDMSLTQNYVVIFDLPVTVSLIALASGASFPFRWDNDHEPRVGLMPRNGGPSDISWHPVSQNYAYHPMNAYEDDDGRVVIDICRYERMFDADIHGPFGDSRPRLDRWTINPAGGPVSEDIVDERPQEFPRCHPDLNSKPYRYGYSLAVGNQTFASVFKHDMQTGQSRQFDLGPGRHGGEAIFVPRQGAAAEDDGYLMAFVFDDATQKSDLVVLDANDMSERAVVSLPARVPYGFHGSWVPDPV